jgi:nitroreductase
MIDDVMRKRRSIRSFRPEVPSRELIVRLVEAAITAPSASNKQPWRFIAVMDRTVIERISQAVGEAVDLVASHIEPSAEAAFRRYGDYFSRFRQAPVLIVPLWRSLPVLSNLVDRTLPTESLMRVETMERDSSLIGVSLAMQNLLLMAHEVGLGASVMTGPLLAGDKVKEILSVPATWEIAALVPVGYPAEEPPSPGRRPVEKVLSFVT